jgi:hypothetical protein
MFHSVSFGDVHVKGTVDGVPGEGDIPDSKASGTALQLRAGVSFKLGGGGGQ